VPPVGVEFIERHAVDVAGQDEVPVERFADLEHLGYRQPRSGPRASELVLGVLDAFTTEAGDETLTPHCHGERVGPGATCERLDVIRVESATQVRLHTGAVERFHNTNCASIPFAHNRPDERHAPGVQGQVMAPTSLMRGRVNGRLTAYCLRRTSPMRHDRSKNGGSGL
jgi:hypothetical protein